MIKITFIDHLDTTRSVDVPEDLSLMEAAVQNLIPGIDGDCGGNGACGTCRVEVEAAWLDRLQPQNDLELALLGIIDSITPNSRLACQIKASRELDGLVVRTPAGQH